LYWDDADLEIGGILGLLVMGRGLKALGVDGWDGRRAKIVSGMFCCLRWGAIAALLVELCQGVVADVLNLFDHRLTSFLSQESEEKEEGEDSKEGEDEPEEEEEEEEELVDPKETLEEG
jgi:Ran GTPase-activating protein (RanGAP) involved in mRNA processing and transport